MSDPFIGQIQILPYQFAPQDWLYCAGQTLNVIQFQALYVILGNTWGGTPSQTFKLPDLSGQAVCGTGQGPGLSVRTFGKGFGNAAISLTSANMPNHNHTFDQAGPAVGQTPSPNVTANCWDGYSSVAGLTIFYDNTTQAPVANFDVGAVGVAGSGTAHENRQPGLAMPYCIATMGVFPIKST